MEIEKKNLVSEGNPDESKSSSLETGVNLFKCTMGIGVLSLPYFFKEAGYMLSIFMMIILGAINFYSGLMLIRLADLRGLKQTDYKELFCDIVGQKAFIFFQMNIVLNYYGICVSYVIFFIQFFNNVFETSGTLYKIAYALASLLVIMPLSLVRNYHFFVKYSFLANIFMVFVLSSVIVYSINNADTDNLENIADFNEVTGIIGAFLFAFEYPGQIIPIRNSIKNPDNFPCTFLSVNIIIVLIYVTFSFICYLGFPANMLTQDILKEFGSINQISLIITAFYAISLVISYPIQLCPMVQVIEKAGPINNFLKKHENNRLISNIVRILCSFFIFVCAIFINSFGDFVSLIGNLTNITVQLVYPLLAYTLFMGNKLNFGIRLVNYFIICISIAATVYASYDGIVTLIFDYE